MESRSSFAQLSQRGFKRRQPSSKSVAFRRPSSNDHNNDENTPLRPRPPPPAPLQSLEALLDPSPALPFPQRAGIRFADRVTPLRREVIRKAAQASEGHEERREGKRVQLDELDEPPLRRYARSPWLEKLRREVWGARREEQDPKQGSSRDHDVDGEPGPSSWEERIARGEVADHQPTPGPNPPNSVHLAAPDPSRLSTAGLPPIRHRLRNSGTIEILPSSHEVLLDLRSRNNGVILISGDGSSLSYFDPRGPPDGPLLLLHPTASYSNTSLPAKHRKHYALATKFLSALRSKTPLLIQFPPPSHARQTIFSDSPPSYTVVLPHSTLLISRSQAFLRLSNPKRSLALPLSITELDRLSPTDRKDVESALALAPEIDKLADAFRAAAPPPPPTPPSTKQKPTTRLRDEADPTARALAAISSPPSPPPKPRSKPGEEEDRRYLPGAGWILRTGDRGAEKYRALFVDGEEVVLEGEVVEIRGRRWRIGEGMPRGVGERLGLVAEMMLLF